MMIEARVAFATVASVVIAACGGGGGSSGSPPPPPPPPTFGPNYSEIQSNVFTPTCAVSGCHTGAGAPQGLLLDDANSYGLLINAPSNQVPTLMRVLPGLPNDSYLVQKLEGTASVGAQMPLGASPLPQSEIDIIRQWISDGAIDDRPPSTEPIRVTSLTPAPGSDGPAPVRIIASFDRELDVSTVNVATFLLDASGGDGTFGDGNEISIVATGINTPAMSPTSATFDLTGNLLQDETYRVRLLGSGPSVILDIDANVLDGEFAGVFPSGDGIAGGDFEATFTVTTPVSGPTRAAIQANIFTPTCAVSGCHTGASAPQGLRLDHGLSFGSLINVPSTQSPTTLRVNPGNPDLSYLVHKLEGTAAVGGRMPLGGPPLDQALIDDVRQWIQNGAL